MSKKETIKAQFLEFITNLKNSLDDLDEAQFFTLYNTCDHELIKGHFGSFENFIQQFKGGSLNLTFDELKKKILEDYENVTTGTFSISKIQTKYGMVYTLEGAKASWKYIDDKWQFSNF